MKSSILILLIVVLLLGVANLLTSFGLIGGSRAAGAGHWEYRVLNAQQMDSIGFNSVGKEVGVQPDEEGKMSLPADKIVKTALLPRTLDEVDAEGWELVSVTSDHHYIFRRPK